MANFAVGAASCLWWPLVWQNLEISGICSGKFRAGNNL